MNVGKNMQSLARAIRENQEAKADFLVSSPAMCLTQAGLDISADHVVMPLQPLAHNQLADYVGIPQRYYQKMQDDKSELLCLNVNHWLAQRSGERRMVRSMGDRVRAILSDRYRRLDHEDVAEAAFPVLMDSQNIELISADITDRKLYLKAVFPRTEAEVKKGDVVQAGVVISNSEVGLGALTVEPLIYRLICLNGAIMADSAFRKMHVGSRYASDVDMAQIFRDSTREADDRALLMAMQDMIRAASKEAFAAMVDKMREAAGSPPLTAPRPAVELLAKRNGLSISEQDSVLEHLIRGSDYTLWGVANAVTAAANDIEDYDRATELQYLGGRLIDLPRSEWGEIRHAKAKAA